MTHIAYYQVLTDNVILPLPNTNPSGTEENETTQKLIFNPANDIELNASGQHRPLISYQVDLESANDFKLRVQVRKPGGALKTINTWTFDGNATRQFEDPFRLEWISNSDNVIFFRKISGNDGVIVRNVVVFYQRDI